MSTGEQNNDVSFRDRIPTVNAKGGRNWIYALKPSGKWFKWRSWLSYAYLILFFAGPFIRINGNPALLLNVVEGKFSILGILFWPQDFFIFGVGMVTMVIFVYLFTMIYGRLFCGWICPQTIFMEMVFRKIEWAIEGNPSRQKALNRGPWNTEKILKKTFKHILFFALSLLIAHTFLAYIIGIDALRQIVTEPVSQHVGGFVALMAFTAVFYAVYAFVREIVCTVVCPYGRLQGVLLDRNSVIVAYDYNRGEPRTKGKRADIAAAGDCIDCLQCVNVCPTGIDIRNGTQLECINCTACIDACNTIMDKVGRPQGLIRYASENNIASKQRFSFTTRMKAYSAVLLLLISAMSFMLITRDDVDATLMRAKGQLYQEVGSDSLSNLYTMTLLNKTNLQKEISLEVLDHDGTIRLVSKDKLLVMPEAQLEVTLFIVIPKSQITNRSTAIRLGVNENGKRIDVLKTNFLGYTE